MCDLNVSIAGITGDCYNTSSGAFTIFIDGTAPDYTVDWINPLYGTIPLGPGIDGYTIDSLSAGTYTFNIIDSCLPTNQTQTVNVTVSSGTCASVTSMTNTSCGLNNGEITVTTTNLYSSTAKFYLYETNLGYISSAETVNNFYPFTNLSAGNYYAIVDDGGGCTGKTETCILKDSNEVTIGLFTVQTSSCKPNVGAIYVTGVTGTPPYSYLWSPGGQTTTSITGLTAGNYTITVTDSEGCIQSSGVTITAAPTLGLENISFTNPNCFTPDGTVTVTVSGGTPPYQYVGSNGHIDTTFSDVNTFYNLPAGFFTVVVKDAGNCSFTATTSLLTDSGLSVTSVNVTNSTCSGNGGKIEVNIFGGTPPYTYTLIDSLSSTTTVNGNFTNWTFTGLFSDTYTLEISDAGPCVFTNTYTVNNNVLFDLSIDTTGTTCGQSIGAVLLSITPGGTPPFKYEIDGTYTFSNGLEQLFENLPSGNYTATVTDANFCQQVLPFTIDGSSDVDFVLIGSDSLNGTNGNVTALITNGTPPFTLSWSSNVNGQTGYTVSNLSAGTYSLTVTDDNGCSKTRTVTINGFNQLSSYQVFNICDDVFEITGQSGRKGPQQMLIEGFHDLTLGDTNCLLNQSIFTLITTVNGVVKTQNFFTGSTLNDFPSDNEFYDLVEELLLSYDGIGEVIVNAIKNTLIINSSCEANLTLLDANVKVELNISYDINCQSCDDFCNCYEVSGPKGCVVSYIDCNGDEDILELDGTKNYKICGRSIVRTSCDNVCDDPISYFFKVLNSNYVYNQPNTYFDTLKNLIEVGVVVTNATNSICCSDCADPKDIGVNFYGIMSLDLLYSTYILLGGFSYLKAKDDFDLITPVTTTVGCCNNYTGDTTIYNNFVSDMIAWFGSTPKQCDSDFNNCLSDLETLIGSVNFQYLYDNYGFGENPISEDTTYLCSLVEALTYAKNTFGITSSELTDVIELILENGLTSKCKNDTTFIGNVKSLYAYLDYTNRGDLPAADCSGLTITTIGECVDNVCDVVDDCVNPLEYFFSTVLPIAVNVDIYIDVMVKTLREGTILDIVNEDFTFCCPTTCYDTNFYFLGYLKTFTVLNKLLGLPDCCINHLFDIRTYGSYVEFTNLGKTYFPKACCNNFEPCIESYYEYLGGYTTTLINQSLETQNFNFDDVVFTISEPITMAPVLVSGESKLARAADVSYPIGPKGADLISIYNKVYLGGLIEVSTINGYSPLCGLFESLKSLPYTKTEINEIFLKLLEIGVYIGCEDGELFIGDYKSYTLWANPTE
jgi:hypothetical protein